MSECCVWSSIILSGQTNMLQCAPAWITYRGYIRILTKKLSKQTEILIARACSELIGPVS